MSGPYGKGSKKGAWQEPSAGESQRGGGKQGHGGASATWRAQMKGLKDFFFPDIDMQTYPGQLTGYCTTVFGLQKDVEETYRQFLCRVHQTVQPGLGCGLKMGWKALALGCGLTSSIIFRISIG